MAFLQHQNPVAHGDPEGAATASLADDGHHHRNLEPGHFAQIARDGLRLAPFFGFDARECPRGVHERDDRPAELFAIFMRRRALRYPSGRGMP